MKTRELCRKPCPLGYYTYLVLYRTARMAPGVFLGDRIVDSKPLTLTALRREVRFRKKLGGWTKVLGVWEVNHRKIKL